MVKIRTRTVFIFLTLLALIVYINSFSSPFHFDDIYYLKENLNIKSFKIFWDWIVEDYSKIFTGRPFLLLTFLLNYKLGGLDTFGYHLLNLLIHIVNAFLLYLLLFRYAETDNPPRPPLVKGGEGGFKKSYSLKYLLVAILFLIHPINTESVTYISSRSSVLSAFFVLASMLCFFRATSPPHPPFGKGGQEGGKSKFHLSFYVLSLLFFIFGLSTKETAIVLPALLLLFDYFFISKSFRNLLSRLKYYLPYLLLISALSILYMHYITAPSPGVRRPWSDHIFTEIKVFSEYLRLLVVPIGLNIDHDVMMSYSFDSDVIISFVILLSLVVIAILLRNSKKIVSFSIFWFFINMAPFLAVRLNDFMAERWLYLASIGFCIGLAEILFLLMNNFFRTGIAITALITIVFGTLTILRNHIYSSPILLWEDAAKKSPDKYRPYLILSSIYKNIGNTDKAIENIEKAINKKGVVFGAYLNLATAYIDKGDYVKAEKILKTIEQKKATFREHDADIGAIYINLGAVYIKMHKYERAVESYKTALSLLPYSPFIRYSIGECYENLSDDKQAREYFILATKGIPQKAQDYIAQGVAFFKIGDSKKALECFYEAVRIDSFDINARMFLGNSLLGNKYYNEAFKHFSLSLKLSPNYAPAYKGMGLAMLAKGNLKEARKHFEKAINLLPPDSPERKELLELLTKTQG